jgi:hypothetical protein
MVAKVKVGHRDACGKKGMERNGDISKIGVATTERNLSLFRHEDRIATEHGDSLE